MAKKTRMVSSLKPLLSRFVEESLLTPDILVSTGKFLFDDDLIFPFFRNNELYEAAVYLKDLMQVNHLKSVESILNYFEKKKKSISVFIDHAIDTQCRENECDKGDGEDGFQESPLFHSNNICISYLGERTSQSVDFSPFLPCKGFHSFVPNITDANELCIERGGENEHETEYSNA